MRVLLQVPAHFMRVCIFTLLLARSVLPYDSDPGAMLNVCKMEENKKQQSLRKDPKGIAVSM